MCADIDASNPSGPSNLLAPRETSPNVRSSASGPYSLKLDAHRRTISKAPVWASRTDGGAALQLDCFDVDAAEAGGEQVALDPLGDRDS